MNSRDTFAANAMAALIQTGKDAPKAEEVAKLSYDYADAMMKEQANRYDEVANKRELHYEAQNSVNEDLKFKEKINGMHPVARTKAIDEEVSKRELELAED